MGAPPSFHYQKLYLQKHNFFNVSPGCWIKTINIIQRHSPAILSRSITRHEYTRTQHHTKGDSNYPFLDFVPFLTSTSKRRSTPFCVLLFTFLVLAFPGLREYERRRIFISAREAPRSSRRACSKSPTFRRPFLFETLSVKPRKVHPGIYVVHNTTYDCGNQWVGGTNYYEKYNG